MSPHLLHPLRRHDVLLVREEGDVVAVRGAPELVIPALTLPLLVLQVRAATRQPQLLRVVHGPGNGLAHSYFKRQDEKDLG